MSPRIPEIPEITTALERVEIMIPKLREEYRWARGHVYGANVGERVNVAHGLSDPTGSIVVGKEKARELTAEAGKEILRAVTLLENAGDKLHGASGGQRRPTLEVGGMGPRMVTRDELADSTAAKRRRERRGEGWGEA